MRKTRQYRKDERCAGRANMGLHPIPPLRGSIGHDKRSELTSNTLLANKG